MTLAFTDDLHDAFATRPASCIPYGGADLGAILAASYTAFRNCVAA